MKSTPLPVLILCAALTLLGGCKPPNQTATPAAKHKIGAVIPLTGEVATYGEALKRGFDIAVAEHGDQFTVIYEDSKADPKTGVSGLQKLISRDNVEAVLGDATSGVCLALGPIAQQQKKVLLITIATSDKLGDAGDYIFRTAPPNALQASLAADFLTGQLKAKNIAILAKDNPYATNLADVFRHIAPQKGATLVYDERYAEDTKDFRDLVTKLAAKSPEAVFVPGNYEEVAQILRTAKELGLSTKFIGTDGAYSPKLVELSAGAAEGFYLTMLSVDEGSAMYKRFREEFMKRHKQEPDVFSAYGYEGATMLMETFGKAASTNRPIKELLTSESFTTMTGEARFDEKNALRRNYGVYQVASGEIKLLSLSEGAPK